jgi:thioredoxin 1
MTAQHATDATIGDIISSSEVPVVLDFWAPWCGPCKSIAPMLDSFAAANQHSVKIVKINVDENPNTAAKYGVRGLPTLILFDKGAVSSSRTGALSEAALKSWIAEAI